MKIESLEEAIRISEVHGLPLKRLLPEKIKSGCGGLSEPDNMLEKDKEYFRKRFEDLESKHCVCYSAEKEDA